MVTYEITATVNAELVPAYEKYMTGHHIPDVLATGHFVSAAFSRNGGCYRIRYEARDQAALEQYLGDDAPRLRMDHQEHFPAGVELSRETWDVLDEFYAPAPHHPQPFDKLENMLVLGIESSCDETAAAVVRDGREILSSVIASQIEMHRPWGGVVPELASREHLEKIEPIVGEAIVQAGIGLPDIDAIAVTQGPGLIGSLLVGVCYAKSLAYALDIPFVGVNHIEGHVYSVAFDNPDIVYPALALIVSGGHTNIFYVPSEGAYKVVSRTRDDAAGEAFDKVAKMLGLGYPGGPIIEKLARTGDAASVRFTQAKISDGRPDLSFSGLKTAVARYIREHDIAPHPNGGEPAQSIKDLAASFQAAVVKALVGTMERIAGDLSPATLLVAGGVACNLALRDAAAAAAGRLGIPVYFPSKHLSTDNAAMIAAAGHFHLKKGERADLRMTADISMRLQNLENEDAQLRKQKVRYRL